MIKQLKDLGTLDVKKLILPLVVVLLDQLLKYFALVDYLKGDFFTLVYNTGITFGAFPKANKIMVVISIVAVVAVFYAMIKSKGLFLIGYSLILGGIIGNLIDRITLGAVVDYIIIGSFPVFNLADMSIVCGVSIIILKEIYDSIKS